jgi:hypothetical protein
MTTYDVAQHARRIATALALTLALTAGPALVGPAARAQAADYRIVDTFLAGDLNGEGSTDVVTVASSTDPYTDVGGVLAVGLFPDDSIQLTAHNGADGSKLFQTVAPNIDAVEFRGVAGRVGPDAKPGVILAAGNFADELYNAGYGYNNAAFYAYKDHFVRKVVQGFDHTGTMAWEVRYSEEHGGAFAYAEQIVIGGIGGNVSARIGADDIAILDQGQYTGNGATDVLLGAMTGVQVGPAGVTNVKAIAVDGATGKAVTLLDHTGVAATRVWPAGGDHNRDGYKDLVLFEPTREAGVGLRSSADGSTIWDVAQPRTPENMWRFDIGDVTGDGIPELSLLHYPSIWGMVPQQLYVLDGATGATLQSLRDERVLPLGGDADGDGDDDLLHVGSMGESDRLTVVNAAGKKLRSTIGIKHEWYLQGSAGDLDDDGLDDVLYGATHITSGYLDERGYDRVMGDPLAFHPGGGYALHASLDGDGDDLLATPVQQGSRLALSALDGRDLDVLWETTLAAPGAASEETWLNPVDTADVSSDGIPDILVHARNSTAVSVSVLDGADGAVRWSIER